MNTQSDSRAAAARGRKRTRGFAALLLLAAVLAAAWWLGRSDETAAQVSAEQLPKAGSGFSDLADVLSQPPLLLPSVDVAGSAPTSAPTVSGEASADATRLRAPLDLPFHEQLPALLERSRAGDGASACRLLRGATHCGGLLTSRSYGQLYRADHGLAPPSEPLASARARARNSGLPDPAPSGAMPVDPSVAFCAGLGADDLPAAAALFDELVVHLSPRQKVMLALMRHDGSLFRLEVGATRYRRGGRWNLWVYPQFLADHAIDFLQQGYAARELLAIEGLVLLHMPATGVTGQEGARLPDPDRFLLYAGLLRSLLGAEALGPRAESQFRSLVDALSPAARADFGRQLAAEARRWQHDLRTRHGEIDPARLGRLYPGNEAQLPGCEDD